jgi:tRNA threonylcarbamoyladenosine biosynthesis protein TsaB
MHRLNILAIETSTSAGSVAVVRVGDLKVLALNEWFRGRSHAEVTTPALADAIKISGGMESLCAISVGVGPGSFTGIRVGLNSAKTAAWNLSLPVLGLSSTSILLEGARASGLLKEKDMLLAGVLNAQMGMVFCGFLSEEPRALTPLEFANEALFRAKKLGVNVVALVGDGAPLVESEVAQLGLKIKKLDSSLDFPHAATLGRMAAVRLEGDLNSLSHEALVRKFTWQSVQPLYLRGSGAEEKRG